MARHTYRGFALMIALALSAGTAAAQGDRDRYGDRDRDRDRDRAVTRLDPGMSIPIRTSEAIDVRRTDEYRVFTGVVVRDVRGDDGRLAIPRGSTAELMVKEARPGEAVLDLESITVNGQRYAVRTDEQAVGTVGRSRPDILGSIVGTITRGEARGREVRVPSNTPVNFRLERPLDVGVADIGVDRNGHHYHDYYGRGRGGQ